MSPELDRLSAAVHSFAELIRSLPAQKLNRSRTQKWGAREVLIHLVFWHEQYAQIASDVFAKRNYPKLSGTFKDINAWAVAQNMSVPANELLDRWVAAQIRLEHLSQKQGASRLKLCLREGSKEWPFFVLIRLAAGHVRRHEEKLTKLLGMARARRLATA